MTKPEDYDEVYRLLLGELRTVVRAARQAGADSEEIGAGLAERLRRLRDCSTGARLRGALQQQGQADTPK